MPPIQPIRIVQMKFTFIPQKENNLTGKILSDLTDENYAINGINRGLYNGYVSLNADHPFYGKHYDEINAILATAGFHIHGGLTYSGDACEFGLKNLDWVIGFDTAHADDTAEKWTKENTLKEIDKLFTFVATFND
jgi:hypothetical protein